MSFPGTVGSSCLLFERRLISRARCAYSSWNASRYDSASTIVVLVLVKQSSQHPLVAAVASSTAVHASQAVEVPLRNGNGNGGGGGGDGGDVNGGGGGGEDGASGDGGGVG